MRLLGRCRVRFVLVFAFVVVGLAAAAVVGSASTVHLRPHRTRVSFGFAAGRRGFVASRRELGTSLARVGRMRHVGPVVAGAEVPGLRRADADTYL